METQRPKPIKLRYAYLAEYFWLTIDALWKSRIGLFIPMAVFFIFWQMDQGYDLLLALPEQGKWGNIRAVWAFFDIVLLASAAWFIPRIAMNLDYVKTRSQRIPKEEEGESQSIQLSQSVGKFSEEITISPQAQRELSDAQGHINRFVPRFLGVFTIFLFAAGVFYIFWQTAFFNENPTQQEILPKWPFLLGTFLLSVGIVLITQKIYSDQVFTPKTVWFFWATGTATLVLLILPLIFDIEILWKLLHLSVITVLLGVLFGMLVTLRRLGMPGKEARRDAQQAKRNLVLRFVKYFTIIYSSCAFLVFNFVNDKSWIFPTSVVFTGLIVYASLATFLAAFKNGKYFLLTWTIVLLFVLNWIGNRLGNPIHDMATVPIESQIDRPELSEHFTGWVKERHDEILASETTYPIFLVLGEGGGSRAAFWTNTVLSTLHDETHGEFSRHTYAISTASGSSFGTGAFLAFLKAKKDLNDTTPIRMKVKYRRDTIRANRIPFEQNYLTASLAHLLGRDYWCSVLPGFTKIFKNYDRERKLDDNREFYIQQALEQMFPSGNGKVENAFEQPFTKLWEGDSRFDIPLFFPNVTRVEDGMRGLVSPLKTPSPTFTEPIDLVGHLASEKKTIKLSTAVNLSARFPYINAGSKVENLGHFVDGGYYDNMGSATMIELFQALDSLKSNSADSVFQNISFHLVRIHNNDRREIKGSKAYPNRNQLGIPLSTIFSIREANTVYSSAYLVNLMGGEVLDFNLDHTLKITEGPQKGNVVFPLARFLSRRAAVGIEKSFDKEGVILKDSTAVENMEKVKKMLGVEGEE